MFIYVVLLHRYCLFVNIIGFVYSGFQAFDLAYHLVTGMHVVSDYLRYHFNFSMDQILAYLLMSASSSAATRVDDWILNWGQDQFTLLASASVGMSFLAFLAFAISSLISGYNICNRDST
ncbi:CASP-like protein 4A3 [Forsythia ovata]|uniref:CASP-like protein n=1 Tax=Forsythia ovata TaxID=205694 RepID=A0ABD1TSN6_9LAMI